MKLWNYIFNNTLTIWGYTWRVYVAMWLLMVVTIVGGYAVLTSSNAIEQGVTKLLTWPDTQQIIQYIPQLLKDGEYITITASGGLDSNKKWALLVDEDKKPVVSIDNSITCEEWFGSNNKWVLLSKSSVCFGSNSRQQVFTYAQLLEQESVSQIIVSDPYQNSPALKSIITTQWLSLTNTNLSLLAQELTTITNAPATSSQISNGARTILKIAVIPLIFTSFISALIITIMSVLGLLLFSLITQGIASLMSYKISFLQAFRISWLPWIILTSIGFATWLIVKLLIWIIAMAWLIYWYLGQMRDHHPEVQSDMDIDRSEPLE